LTATEKIVISENETDKIYSMDNEELYGLTIVSRTLSESINQEILTDFKLVWPLTDSEPLEIIKSAFDEYPIKHLLVYCNRKDKAQELVSQCQEQKLDTFYLDGDLPRNERNEVLSRFEKSPRALLISIRVLQEGISLPYVDSCYFADSRQSPIDIIQIVGRCLRLYPGKVFSYIFLAPEMISLVTTLLANDPVFASNFRRRCLTLGITKYQDIKPETNFSGQQKIQEILRRVQFASIFRSQIWDYKLNLCLEWEQENPEKTLPQSLEIEGLKIGIWLSTQKRRFNKMQDPNTKGSRSPMTAEEREKIRQLYTWRSWEEKFFSPSISLTWDQKLQMCLDWEQENPEKNLPQRLEIEGVKIGKWLSHQKTRFNKMQDPNTKGSRSPMTPEEREKLQRLYTWRSWEKFFSVST